MGGASQRIFELLERAPAACGVVEGADAATGVKGRETTGEIMAVTGELALQNVSFSYPSRPDVPVLRDFSLRIPANSTAALVGVALNGPPAVPPCHQHNALCRWVRRGVGRVRWLHFSYDSTRLKRAPGR